ncbi:MAG: DUF1573 domain-containing protein [Prevotella sp.]|jgi:hypothetical protein|nr:DUF1573 domain-containing protein [Prevotella sp.]
MKKLLMITFLLMATFTMATAQKQAQIKFDKLTHDFGTFSESSPVVECTFTFKNVGEAPLIINQAVASCGCTVPSYTKEPIAPGATGAIKVTYNGKGKFPGHFKKTITIRTNGATELTRLYVEGNMTEAK